MTGCVELLFDLIERGSGSRCIDSMYQKGVSLVT